MGKRIPTPDNVPHLRNMQPNVTVKDIPKRHGLVQTQTVLSTQDIPDVTTPEGKAMLNDELRRIRLAYNEKTQEVTPTATAVTPTPASVTPSTTIINNSALTVKHNNQVVGEPKIVQSLNFKDTIMMEADLTPILFDIKSGLLESQYSAFNTGANKEAQRERILRAYSQRKLYSGIIEINTLPDQSTPYNNRDVWKREGAGYNPSAGYYGWYVYNYIPTYRVLKDPNQYILSLIDLHEIVIEDINSELAIPDVVDYLVAMGTNMDDPVAVEAGIYDYYHLIYASEHGLRTQVFYPEHEGLRIKYIDGYGIEQEQDIIIIRAIYKPDLFYYNGIPIGTQEIEYIDTDKIRTNIKYHYLLEV